MIETHGMTFNAYQLISTVSPKLTRPSFLYHTQSPFSWFNLVLSLTQYPHRYCAIYFLLHVAGARGMKALGLSSFYI